MKLNSDMIDDQGMMHVLVPNMDHESFENFELTLTIQDPETGKLVEINSIVKKPQELEYEQYLNSDKVNIAIEEIKKINLLLITDAALKNQLSKILSFGNSHHSMTIMNLNYQNFVQGMLLFRVRWVHDYCEVQSPSDLSYVPDKYIDKIKIGRLNDKQEQIMYLADNHNTAIKEVKLKKGDKFYLSIFSNKQNLELIEIGSDNFNENSPYYKVNKIISAFLVDEFKRKVPNNRIFEYRMSNMIGKYFYNYNLHNKDGWLYPSIANEKAYNMALSKEKSDSKIEFICTFRGEMTSNYDYLLSYPQIKNVKTNKLISLKDITNLESKNYNQEVISLTNNFLKLLFNS